VTAFYDIDTPVTLSALERGNCEYLSRELVARFSLYLSFTGGPTLRTIERDYGSPMARALYCSVDPEMYFPEPVAASLRDAQAGGSSSRGASHSEAATGWSLGYLGTYSDDRQPTVKRLLIEPAVRLQSDQFVVAGPMYPDSIDWPPNVQRITHIEPKHHREFYNAQRFTLNVTRADMIRAGYSPSVRLFEAAACGTPIISDEWLGLGEFFEPGREILIASTTEDVMEILREMPESDAREIGRRARERVLAEHTAAHRAAELVAYIDECRFRAADNRSVCVTKE
jgi:spore maturation protein CgeB